MTESDVTPDYPASFGRKCSWLAIRSDNPQAVIAALNLRDVQVSGWNAGIDAAYKGLCFVSPPVQQWILAVSTHLPDPGDERHEDLCTLFLLKLAQQFPDVQFFATHRGVSYCAWARLVDGQIVRQFAWVEGSRRWNVGAETPQEIALGLQFQDSSEIEWPEDEDEADELAETIPTPGEDDVLRLAGAWSIDPSSLAEQNLPAGLGYVGRMLETPQ
jgi:hypothetical protein